MDDTAAGDHQEKELSEERVKALGVTLASSLGGVKQGLEQQVSMLLGMVAIIAAMPQTADADPARVGAAIQALTMKQAPAANPEKMRQDMTRMASTIIDLARKLRDANFASDRPPSRDGVTSGNR